MYSSMDTQRKTPMCTSPIFLQTLPLPIFSEEEGDLNQKIQSPMKVKNRLIPRAQRRKLKILEDNGMVAYLEETLKSRLEGFEGLIMSTNGHLPTESHQEGTSDPTRMNQNETLSVARDVEELKKGKSNAIMEQRVGVQNSHPFYEGGYQGRPQVRGGRRGGLGGRGYHRPQEFPRHEASHEDNLYEDYGDNPNIGQAYHGGYYGNQQEDKALDKIKWKGPSIKGENDLNVFLD
ncbi:hypothetical protein M9H77_03215 [Catharanthus roseus]|uniref:Uncharacterized protein n=1 Tax=Catharanthus roseus TaxID=4058 RepID=A0ACC0CAV5_CATRO|nr:hypothetical protein M9H77_03215 [Catharanthus roseus]